MIPERVIRGKVHRIGHNGRIPCPFCKPTRLYLKPSYASYVTERAPATDFRYSFGMFLLHLAQDHGPKGSFERLLRWGFLDGTSECGLIFWRLDFWRAHYRRALREPEYEWSCEAKKNCNGCHLFLRNA